MAEIYDFDAALRAKRAGEVAVKEPTTHVSMHLRDGLLPLVDECVTTLNVQRKVQVVELGIQVIHALTKIAKNGTPGTFVLQFDDSTKWKVNLEVDTSPDRKLSFWEELRAYFRFRL